MQRAICNQLVKRALREGLPAADSPRERRMAQAVAMLNASEVTA